MIKQIFLGRNILGGDWLILGEVAYLGKIKTLSHTTIYRDASHLFLKDPWQRLCTMCNLPGFAKRVPWLWVALEIRFALKRSEIISDNSNRKRIAKLVYHILMNRFRKRHKGFSSFLYRYYSRLYYPFFARKMRQFKPVTR